MGLYVSIQVLWYFICLRHHKRELLLLSGRKVANFSDQNYWHISSVVGAYWNPCLSNWFEFGFGQWTVLGIYLDALHLGISTTNHLPFRGQLYTIYCRQMCQLAFHCTFCMHPFAWLETINSFKYYLIKQCDSNLLGSEVITVAWIRST